MAGAATARRMEGGRNAASRTPLRPRMEPVLAGPVDRAAWPALSAPAPAGAVFRRDEDAPPVQVPPQTIDAAGAAPAVAVPAPTADDAPLGAAVFNAERPVSSCPMPARRLSLSIIASIALHGAAAAAFVWLGLKAPAPISAGEEGIPVELVVAADTGSAAREEAASGRQETPTPSSDSDARQAVEAPPAEASPELAAVEPVEAPTDTPPAAQPDPLTNAERVVDQLPPPPMPEALAVAEAPLEPPPIETQSVAEPVTAPSEHPVPQQIEAAAVTPQMAELQAAPAEPVVPPTPAPAVQPPSPPVIRREAVRSPPTRREAPTARERSRPTRQAAATSQPERPAHAARQVEARASRAERGEGAGQRNRQPSDATGATGAATTAAVAQWRQRVLAHLARYKVYPESARDAGIRGRTAVSFTLTAGGSVSSVAIASSSGAAVLDQATLAMVRRAQPFPPNPAGSPASFTAGINYSLY